jgi:hypothetical protein
MTASAAARCVAEMATPLLASIHYTVRHRAKPAAGGGPLKAGAELAQRERRVADLDIRPLSPPARAKYRTEWTVIQEDSRPTRRR